MDLTNNNLTSLPSEFRQLELLRTLNLKNNSFTAIPPEIFSLTALETLNLDSNNVATVASEIANLTSRTELNLTKNELKARLPSQMFEMVYRVENSLKIILNKNPEKDLDKLLPSNVVNLREQKKDAETRSDTANDSHRQNTKEEEKDQCCIVL